MPFDVVMLLQAPVVVDPKSLTEEIDLLSANDHLTHSEVSATPKFYPVKYQMIVNTINTICRGTNAQKSSTHPKHNLNFSSRTHISGTNDAGLFSPSL